MTTPDERTRALIWAGGFLIELAKDKSLPLHVRRRAIMIARHFPTIEAVRSLARSQHPTGMGLRLSEPDDDALPEMTHGPLTYCTRLGWPIDEGQT